VPVVGALSVVKFGIFFRSGHLPSKKISADAVENSVEKASRLRRCDEDFRMF
jgi:hypothetical protein